MRHNLYFTPEDWQPIQSRADALNLPVSSYLRQAAVAEQSRNLLGQKSNLSEEKKRGAIEVGRALAPIIMEMGKDSAGGLLKAQTLGEFVRAFIALQIAHRELSFPDQLLQDTLLLPTDEQFPEWRGWVLLRSLDNPLKASKS